MHEIDESIGLMEPMLIADNVRQRGELSDLALELAQKSSGLLRSLPVHMVDSLATLVRSMNCYYSNLIEGHNTHPIDIERALKQDLSDNPRQRDLQLEAKAHIMVQQWIDAGGVGDEALNAHSIRLIHQKFCELLPDELLWVEHPTTGERLRVVAGEYREHDVQVGRHIPIKSASLPRFMERFDEAYARLGKTDMIFAAACAHHRLLWIHPFLDGNGRVARLVSHAVLLQTLNTGGLWSVARGLARNVEAYKSHLAACDLPRRNDLDGRGSLSEEALVAFTKFFLTVCIDQVDFMENLIQPQALRMRIQRWADESIRMEKLPPKSGAVLDAILYRGELPRSEVAAIVGTGDRQARRILSALMDAEVVSAESTRAPLRLVFPARLAGEWMPGLFPDKV